MCSFLITNINNFDLKIVNYFLKFRGPDNTNKFIFQNFVFIHNLLHITGEKTIQPFKKNNIICLYNGEIYNYKNISTELNLKIKSDGECLIPLYEKYGTNFIKYLDGEFAIALFDFEKNHFILSTDVFSTKPLWIGINDNNIGISTYESSLLRLDLKQTSKLLPNTTYIFNINNFKLLEEKRVFTFDLNNQIKKNYDDWCVQFINSVRKRSENFNSEIFVGLSSGYDSGSICCALNLLNKKYNSFTIPAKENMNTINKRNILNKKCNSETLILTKKEFNEIKNDLKENSEKFKNCGVDGYKFLIDDKAAVGLSKICNIAKKKGNNIYLSGQGSDEIYSDYGFNGKKFYGHSCFGGRYPLNLNDILKNNPKETMIWKSFYGGTQYNYLNKEEIVSGRHGIEGRYPFLDKNLVQEFLWLTPELKNKNYKAPLHYFMNKHNYPFDVGKKLGFSANHNLK